MRPFARVVVAYIAVSTMGNLLWETAQLPLYTVWRNGTPHEILIALIHCTGGDLLIVSFTLAAAAVAAHLCGWPQFGLRMGIVTLSLGVAYTTLSEWLNVEVWRRWAYAPTMLVVKIIRLIPTPG